MAGQPAAAGARPERWQRRLWTRLAPRRRCGGPGARAAEPGWSGEQTA